MELISCKNLSVGYGGHAVRSNLNFTINEGDYFAIVGENGSGKSTLMKTLLGLISPIEGEIIYAKSLSPKEIGYLPQQAQIQRDFPASVAEIVLSGRQAKVGLKPFYSKEDRAIATSAMEKMSIMHLSKKCYRQLSGGQQQRVLLARALAAASRVILLDEPVAGLDPKVTEDLYQVICDLNKDGITVIMISHDISSVEKYATNVLKLGGEAHAR